MDITVKSFFDLDADERARLMELSPPDRPPQRELFRRLLRHQDPVGMYTAMVRTDDGIVGWAGASMGEGWNAGMIGVVVASAFRGQGYARAAVRVLVSELKRRHPDWPEYLYYSCGFERLFSGEIEAAGFKDRWLHSEEYDGRLRRI